jgi:hypothetical protein
MLHTYTLNTYDCEGESPCTLVNTAGAKEQITTAVVRMMEIEWKEGRKKSSTNKYHLSFFRVGKGMKTL